MERIQNRQNQGTSSIVANSVTVVYFSSVSENTKRFVDRLGGGLRIPLRRTDPELIVTSPYILITPSYGAGRDQNTVPRQVIHFLNNEQNRGLLLGVIGSGSTHYGKNYCRAAYSVAAKCQVPLLYTYELLGLPEDVAHVQEILRSLSDEPEAPQPDLTERRTESVV